MRAFLPDDTRVAQVHLRTARLATAVEFYSGVLGLEVVAERRGSVEFAATRTGPVLLVLSECTREENGARESTGLCHFALRFERRPDLAQAYQRLVGRGYPLEGASDHGVSEAIYLNDPDGHGLELCADRPRDQWSWCDEQIAMVSRPLDKDGLLRTLGPISGRQGTSGKIDLGHVHLRVPDLSAAERFYGEFLGFAVTQRDRGRALFFAAGGYHHHIGVNSSAGGTSVDRKQTGLVSYRLQVHCPDLIFCLEQRAPLLGYETRLVGATPPVLQVRDPNGNWLEVQSSASFANGGQSPHCANHISARKPQG